jgi:transcriptional regulator with XRE-family HTH domain
MSMRTTPFGALLAQLRQELGISQSRLAAAAGLGHSAVSRLENGQRHPERATVKILAEALWLSYEETNRLLASAGYVTDEEMQLADEPDVRRLLYCLADPEIPWPVKRNIRAMLGLLANQARLSTQREAVA